MLEGVLNTLRLLVPKPVFNFFQPAYHYLLAIIANELYRPMRSEMVGVIFVTGTKGKTTVCELLNFVLNETGHKSVVSSTLRNERSTPGRFALRKFLQRASLDGCQYAVIEMTSQAVLQYRHKFLNPIALIFTGIHPEHIEAHGSFENYLASKLKLAKERPFVIVANTDDKYGERFLSYARNQKIGYSLSDWFTPSGVEGNYETKLPGDFNKMNVLAVAKLCLALGLPEAKVREAIKKFEGVPGRVEFVPNNLGIDVVVDYAHTPGSLQAIYEAMSQNSKSEARNPKLICVLGACGGGRDKWKRPEFGRIADEYCSRIILTDEDPYDENPREIVEQIAEGVSDKNKLEIELDRRKAIARALRLALPLAQGSNQNPVVLITGKGTDNFIHGPRGHNIPWSDRHVAEEELSKIKHA